MSLLLALLSSGEIEYWLTVPYRKHFRDSSLGQSTQDRVSFLINILVWLHIYVVHCDVSIHVHIV
jgi:hypothetical protein